MAGYGGGQVSGTEISYEVNYGFAVAPGMMIKPFAGFISHPDQATSTAPTGNNTHALFFGVMFDVNVSHLLGLPSLKE